MSMILNYHKIAPVAKSHWWITVDRFYEQIQALRSRQVVSLDNYDPTNENHAVITFDGVYDNIFQYAFPILKHFGYPFELFVIGDYIGCENKFDQADEPPCYFADETMLREMCAHGGRVQWHTRSHRALSVLSAADVAAELSPPEALSTQFTPPNLRWFAYPHGEINPEHRAAIRRRFTGALACSDGNAGDMFNLPRKLVFADTSLFQGTVAAIVANYNYGRYLREAIDSLERQSSRPEEVLIIDDASTDDSETVLQELEAKGYRVVRNEKNLGIVNNFNKAVSLTKADYIFFLGADNRLRSDYLLELRTALDHSPSIAVAYSDMTIFGPLSGKLAKAVGAEPVANKRMENEIIYLWRFPEPEGEALENFANRNFVHGSSMYRRSFYEKVGGYKLAEGPEDHNLFYRMWRAGGGLRRVPKPLLEYRQHSTSQANTALSAALELKALRTELKMLRKAQAPDLAGSGELRATLVQLRDVIQGIRTSRAWPLIRIVRPLRTRFKRAAHFIEEALKHASGGGADLPPCDSRQALVDAAPMIAQKLSNHGMRPGQWVAPEVTKAFQKHGFTVVANTFYAVTPDLNELDDGDWPQEKYATAWRSVKMRPFDAILGKVAEFLPELSKVPITLPDEQGQFYWDNPMFSPLDAAAYYGIIRALEPRHIVEVGSGYSTTVALMAAKHSSRPAEVSCIEPYPSPFLLQQQPKLKTLIRQKVQDVDPLIFGTLEPGDILFIDSSHCTRLGSDLNFLLFEAIPRLKAGVYIHFHDIFLPSEYPRNWLEDIGIMWNEQYLLLAFLMFNEGFEVFWSSSIAGSTARDRISKMFSESLPKKASFVNNLGPYSGGSIWIQKLR